jgi:hypothetical protein
MDRAAVKAVAYNPVMSEYWIQDRNVSNLFMCCNLAGVFMRDVVTQCYDTAAFTFDAKGDMYVCGSTQIVTKFR